MTKRRFGPLQQWRATYNFVSVSIRETKNTVATGQSSLAKQEWTPPEGTEFTRAQISRFRRKLQRPITGLQRDVEHLRAQARRLMAIRPEAAKEAKRLWDENRGEYDHRKHNQQA